MADLPHDYAREVLAAGVRWLFEVEQPAGALLQHHGFRGCAGGRAFGLCPRGWGAYPVVSVEVANPQFGRWPRFRLLNPYGGVAETALYVEALRELGHPVQSAWNGQPGQIGVSLSLAHVAHPSLLAAVERYQHGCPQHRSVFCGNDHGCDWYRDGHARVVCPAWPQGGVGDG